jgi:GNAT superfamily N-acetyltransferase
MVELVPMTEADYRRYAETAVEDYAQSRFKCGGCSIEEARANAKDSYAELLPSGTSSPGQHLYKVLATDVDGPVGMIWVALGEQYGTKTAYVYDLEIAELHRGKGYGAGALECAERLAREWGAVRISLNVWGWNHAARSLYEKAGYAVIGIGMSKFFD